MYYHVRITTKSNPSQTEVELDINSQALLDRFVAPYKEGRPIVINGRVIYSMDIDRILINHTGENSGKVNSFVTGLLHIEGRDMPVDTRGRLDPEILAAEGEIVTSRFIKGTTWA